MPLKTDSDEPLRATSLRTLESQEVRKACHSTTFEGQAMLFIMLGLKLNIL